MPEGNSLDPRIKRKAKLLLDRLERISADSPFAHQASGVRASLSKCLESDSCSLPKIEDLLFLGYHILENAAREIPQDQEE